MDAIPGYMDWATDFTFSKQITGSGKFDCSNKSKYVCDIDSGTNGYTDPPITDGAYIEFITCPS